MTQRQSHGAKGEMLLYHDWEESSSGHLEIDNKATLTVGTDGRIVMTVSYDKQNFYRASAGERRKTVFAIGAIKLAELIEKNGQRIP